MDSGANIRDYRLTFPCIGAHSATTTITAHPTTIADGTSNTLILKETAATYVCNVR